MSQTATEGGESFRKPTYVGSESKFEAWLSVYILRTMGLKGILKGILVSNDSDFVAVRVSKAPPTYHSQSTLSKNTGAGAAHAHTKCFVWALLRQIPGAETQRLRCPRPCETCTLQFGLRVPSTCLGRIHQLEGQIHVPRRNLANRRSPAGAPLSCRVPSCLCHDACSMGSARPTDMT